MDVRKKIKKILFAKKMSIYELALKSDLTDACIRNWYNKRKYVPSIEALIKVCEALNITMSELFWNGEEMVPMTLMDRQMYEKWLVLSDEQKNAINVHINSYLNK